MVGLPRLATLCRSGRWSRDGGDGVVVVVECEGGIVDGLVCGGHRKGVGAGFERTTKMESENDS
jgi:hypothetical protein